MERELRPAGEALLPPGPVSGKARTSGRACRRGVIPPELGSQALPPERMRLALCGYQRGDREVPFPRKNPATVPSTRSEPVLNRAKGVHDRSCAPGDQEGAARGVPHGAFGVPPSGGKNWSDPRKRGTPNGGGRPRKYGHAPVLNPVLEFYLSSGIIYETSCEGPLHGRRSLRGFARQVKR